VPPCVPPPLIPGHRYENIDALRGIAAMLVVWLHGAELFVRLPGMEGRGQIWYDIAHTVDFGRIGVVAFFMISGYVIPPTLRGPLADGTRRFLVRRFFRLFPAYWLSIPLGYLLLWLPWGKDFDVVDVIANATMLPAVFGREATIGLYWTLEAELAFYTLCVALFVVGVLRQRAALLLLVGVLVALMLSMQARVLPSPELAQWKLLPYNLSLMFAGSLVRQAHDTVRRGTAGASETRDALIFALLAVGLTTLPALGSLIFGKNVESQLFARAYLIGIATFVVTVVAWSRPHRYIIWLGTISYSLYLLHPVVLYAMTWMLTYVWHVPAPIGVGTLLLVLAAGAIALASLVYVSVELPAINYARRLTGPDG